MMQIFPNWFDLSEHTQNWLFNLYIGIGCGIVASVGLFLAVDYYILREDRKEKLARNQIALDGLRDLLKSHFEAVLFGMYRASTKTEKSYSCLEELFDDDYINEIQYLDYNKSPFKDGEPKYCNIIPEMNENFKMYLKDEVLFFGQYLEIDILRLIQKIRFSKFIKECRHLPNMCKPIGNQTANVLMREKGVISPNYLPWNYNNLFYETLREHTTIYIALVKLHDKYTQGDILLPSLLVPNTGDVKTGCCRVDETTIKDLVSPTS